MASIGIELAFLLFLILANGVFALSEIALVSSRKARLQQWADEGNHGARAAIDLANAPTRFLSTVQIGITVVGTIAGVFSGATLAEPLGKALSTVPVIGAHSKPFAVATVVLGVSYLSLVLGELAPKRIALNNPERVVCYVARPMRGLSKFASPAVWVLTATTEFIMWILQLRTSEEPPVTEEEIRLLIRQGTKAGVFEEVEQAMVNRVLSLDNRRVSSLMTPRREVVWLDINDSPEKIRRTIAESNCSRFPVRDGNAETVLGIVQVTDLLAAEALSTTMDLRLLLRPPMFVPESTRALKLLEQFKSTGVHLALIIDEYGSLQGLVTLTDIMEAIVGDISSVEEQEEPMVIRREDGTWLLDGSLPVQEVRAVLHLRALQGEDAGAFETLGGFVMSQMGKIPASGEHFEAHGFRFEVMDMDGRRVDKVLVAPVQSEEPESAAPPEE